MRERGFNFKMQASLISQITSDGISTVPYETVVSAQKSRAPFHNGITVGCCWGQKANPSPNSR